MASVEAGGPVFILTMHRAGGTVLARILNTHPDLVIWGEHVGLINQLAKIDTMVRNVSFMMDRKTDEQIIDYARFPDHRLNDFDPWTSGFDYQSFCRSSKKMIEDMFTCGLMPGQRWGFKEIRYHSVQTIEFLQTLFPTARFIILRRNIADVAVSGILAPWSLIEFQGNQDYMPESLADDIISDVTYALLAIESGLDSIVEHLGERCMILRYDQLLDPSLSFVEPLFRFCQLNLFDAVRERIRAVLAVRSGATEKGALLGGLLSADMIRKKSNERIPLLRAEISERGINRARLVARTGIGRFSFLAGDHHMHDGGVGVSSLFDHIDERPLPRRPLASDSSVTFLLPEHPSPQSMRSSEIIGQQESPKRLGIIIPYRDRPNHIAKLLPHLVSYFHRHQRDEIVGVKIVVVEQADDLPFNRGALLNAGFLAVENCADYVCFHDVDYIPMWADYTYTDKPTRIVWWGMNTRPIRVADPSRQTVAPREGLGAVSIFPTRLFRTVNGYSNRFQGWGFEDKDLAAKCAIHGTTIAQRDGTFIPLDHDNAGYQDDGSKSPSWIANEACFVDNQRDYTLHGTGGEGLSTFAAPTKSETIRVVGLDETETADVLYLAVTFEPTAAAPDETRATATKALLRALRPTHTPSVIVPGAAEAARRAPKLALPARLIRAAPVPRRHTICLAMIVKNEAPVIARCLASVRPMIDHWVVVDTGSTDGTQDIVRDELAGTPGALYERPWVDFAHNRSEALDLARGKAEYTLIIDADDVLDIPPGFRLPVLKEDVVAIEIHQQERRYWRPQMVRNSLSWRYEGVLHEFLSLPAEDGSGRVLPEKRSQRRVPGLKIIMSEDGARRRMVAAVRYRQDADLLEAALQTETDPFLIARYNFYLGESRRDAGDYQQAVAAYERRAGLGFWDQEIFISLMRAAALRAELGEDDEAVIDTYLRAHAACPTRAEALHGAARFCRTRERFEQGFTFAQRGLAIRKPADALFLEAWIYDYGLLDEYAVNAYWIGRYDLCRDACRKLLASKAMPVEEKGRVQANLNLCLGK